MCLCKYPLQVIFINKVWKCFYTTAGALILLTAKYTVMPVCIKYACIFSLKTKTVKIHVYQLS